MFQQLRKIFLKRNYYFNFNPFFFLNVYSKYFFYNVIYCQRKFLKVPWLYLPANQYFFQYKSHFNLLQSLKILRFPWNVFFSYKTVIYKGRYSESWRANSWGNSYSPMKVLISFPCGSSDFSKLSVNVCRKNRITDKPREIT